MWRLFFGSKKKRSQKSKKPVKLEKPSSAKLQRHPELEALKAQPIPKRRDPQAVVERMGGTEHLAEVIKSLIDEDRRHNS